MRIFTLPDILPVLEDKASIIEAVKQGMIAHSQGDVDMPPPVQMLFGTNQDSLSGDCHIKTAAATTSAYFCVKVATGFYNNPTQDLPVNNGLVMLFSSETGTPLALFQDQGYLTSARTAAAGALAVSLYGEQKPFRLGILGTGNQAELQARWTASHLKVSQISIWGRSQEKSQALADRLETVANEVQSVETLSLLGQHSDVIVTTTPATSPVLLNQHVQPGHHIIALGADSPGKVELDPAIFVRAARIFTDDHYQCLDHGEVGNAVRSGTLPSSNTLSFGSQLQQNTPSQRKSDDISIVDLTGLGAQDLAIASLVWQKLAA